MKLPDRKLHKFPDGSFRFRNPALRELEWDFTGDLLRGLEVDGPSTRRVVALLDAMLRADSISEELVNRNPEVNEWYSKERDKAYKGVTLGELRAVREFDAARIRFEDKVSQALYDELMQLYPALKKMLSRYKWGPTASFSGTRVSYHMDYGGGDRAREWENWCVAGIVQFYNAGMLSLFRRCRQCGVWFFSLSEHQKYCSDNCRQKFASQSDEFKEKRRKYMKKYRDAERQRDERARRLAARRSASTVKRSGKT